jgi:hypothetical protein
MFLASQKQQLEADARQAASKDPKVTENILHRRALAMLCLVLLNTNEFGYLS